MAFLDKLTTLFFKIEGTPYTAETSFTFSDSLPCENIEISPEISSTERKTAFGDFAYCPSVAGKRSGSIKFDVPIYYSGTASTPPKYFELLRACGMKQTAHGATGVSLAASALYTNVPVTIVVDHINEGTAPVIKRYKFSGCMGEPTLSAANVGEYAKISFEFKGVYNGDEDIAYASYVYPSFSCYSPEVILGIGLSVNGINQNANSFTVKLNNDVQLFTDLTKASGFSGAHLTGQHPTMECDPDELTVASEDIFTQITGDTPVAAIIELTGGIDIVMPKAQLITSGIGSRENHYVMQKKFELQRDGTSDAVLEIIHGSKT